MMKGPAAIATLLEEGTEKKKTQDIYEVPVYYIQ